MKKAISPLFQIGLCTFGYLYATSNTTLAQVTSDNTVNTEVNQNGSVAEITGGETRDSNLFHSFQEFSVPTGNQAFFNNATDISNIFSRVTGGKVSNIDGLIRANGDASLFLINPAGIIFGEGARLDIGGSFYGSSASSILFEDGEFSAVDLENPPLLTVNAPIGLGFRDNPGDIQNNSMANEGRGLEVAAGRSISLLGGDINFDGGKINASSIQLGGLAEAGIIDFNSDNGFSFPDAVTKADVSLINNSFLGISGTIGGLISVNANNITLGGLSQAGEIEINPNGSFNFPDDVTKADLSLSNSALVNVASDGGGFINVDARNVTLAEESQLLAGIGEGLGNANAVAGDIIVNASESIKLIGDGQLENPEIDLDAGIRNLVGLSLARQNNPDQSSTAKGDSGSIFINTDLLEVTERADINIRIYGTGNAGDVNIDANSVVMNEGGITSQVRAGGRGNSGSINIDTNSFDATNLSFLITDHEGVGEGNAGNINLSATDSVVIEGNTQNNTISAFISSLEPDVIGNAGDINIKTDSLTLNDNAQLLTQAKGIGNAGNVNIIAENNILIDDGADIIAQVLEGAEGNSGDVNLTTGSLQILNGSTILTDTKGTGDAGDIVIDADESIQLKGGDTQILTEVGENASGNAGDVQINADSLTIEDGAAIKFQTRGAGDAGDLQINAANSILVKNNSEIIGQVVNDVTGNSGLLDITTKNLSIAENSRLSVDNLGQGDAGNIIVNSESIQLEDRGAITATTITGQGGNIQLEIDDTLTMKNNSLLSAQARGNADGGNITIDTDFIIAFPSQNNDIIANAEQGNGGNINITAESLLGIKERALNPQTNDINASSEFSLDGNVTINTPDINPLQGATELPTNVVEPQQTTTQACQANREIAAKNNLIIKGKGGVPPAPHLPLNSHNITINGENTDSTASIPQPIETSQGKIQPARGITVTKDGRVILTAYRTNNQGDRLPPESLNCDRV